jgi:8-oxo-dGTP diphosphatase
MNFRFCPGCGAPLRKQFQPNNNHRPIACEECNFVYYKSPRPCAGAVLVREKQILLIRRANEPFKDFWDFPGGFLNYGEHPVEGLKREVFEELNVKIKVAGLIGFYMDFYGESKESTLNIYYSCQIVNGALHPKSEIRDARWFDLHRLPENIAFNHAREVLRDWSKMNGGVNSQ